jgi:hypothetical protein
MNQEASHMWNTIRRVLLIAAGLSQLACSEGTSPRAPTRDLELVLPGLDRIRPSFVEEEPTSGGGSPPSQELPAEFQQAPSIFEYQTNAGFQGAEAWAQGFMRYYATHARQDVSITVRSTSGASVTPPPFKGAQSDLWPAERALSTNAGVVLDKSCGYSSNASTTHSAWHEFPLIGRWASWGHTDIPSRGAASQPPCGGDTGDGGGGGGGGTIVQVCYCRDYYSHATGEWVHGGIIYCLEA